MEFVSVKFYFRKAELEYIQYIFADQSRLIVIIN